MMKPREYMDGLRRCAARVERAAGEIGRVAQQGLVPDAAAFDELRSARNELERLRGELNALLGRLRAEWSDSAALTLDQLEERVDEWELRERIGAGIVGRIGDAAERLERVHAPGCGITPVGELARQAAQALERRDMERLNELERQAAPYLDLCVLLSGDIAAAQNDGELLRRLDKWYPQVVWYVRARMKLQHDIVEFDDISDSAVSQLRRLRLDPITEQELSVDSASHDSQSRRAPQGMHSHAADGHELPARRADDMDKHQDPASSECLPSGGGCVPGGVERTRLGAPSIYGELARRIRACGEHGGRVQDWRPLANDYPELRALNELMALQASGSAQRAQSGALVKRALAQAMALDEIIQDARMFLTYGAGVRPGDAEIARAWMALMAPGRGAISVALETVAARRRQGYAQTSALCERLLIGGLPNGLRLKRLGELVPELGGEKLVELLRLIMPGLLVLGRWQTLLAGEIARRMGRIQPDDADGGALRLNEQYAHAGVYRRVGGNVWRRVSPRPGGFNRQK